MVVTIIIVDLLQLLSRLQHNDIAYVNNLMGGLFLNS